MQIKGEKTILWLSLVILTVLMYWPIFSSGRLPGGEMSDTVAQGYPFFSYTASRLSQGELPLWNPYILCGVPFYESFSSPVFYPLRGIPLLLFGPEAAIRFLFPLHLVLAGFFAWLFLKSIGVSRWGSLTGAVAYSSGAWANTLFYAGHGSKIICWAWFPLVLWATVRFIQTKNPKYIGLGGLAVGMQGLSSHPQMMLYTAGSAFIISVFLLGKPVGKAIRVNLGGLFGILLLGGAVAAVQLYPGYLFSGYTSRGNDLSLEAASSYSLPPEETLTMVLPGMFGTRHGFSDSTVGGIPVYFGRLGLRLSSEFTGVAFFLLGMLGLLFGGNRRAKYALLALCITGTVISWGGYTPLFSVLYRIIPVIRKLRAPHMAAFITTASIAMASGLGFDAVFISDNSGIRLKRLALALAGVCLLFLFLVPAAGAISNALQSSWWARNGVSDTSPFGALTSRRASLLETDLLRVFWVTGSIALLVYLRGKARGSAAVFALGFLTVSALELIPFNRGFQVYLPAVSIDSMYPDAPALREMTGSGRVFPGGNSFIPLGIRSVAGYHAARTTETETLLNLLSGSSPWVIRQTAMNTFVTDQGAANWEQIWPALSEGIQSFPRDPMPRAFIPRSIIEGSREEGFQAMEGGWNPQLRSVIEETPSVHDGVLGTAEIITDEPELVTVRTETAMAGFLVLADTWYPRWSVTVDGEQAEVFRANGWMRAVPVPSGEHLVVFSYDSHHIRTGGLLSIIALIISAGLILIFGRKNA